MKSKLEKLREFLSHCSYKMIMGLFIVFTFSMSFMTLVFKTTVKGRNEHAILSLQPFYILVGVVFVFLVLYALRNVLEKISIKHMSIILSLIYLILGSILIFTIDAPVRADAGFVFKAMNEFSVGNYSALQHGNYLSYYPHQLGLVLYESLLGIISKNPTFFYYINLIQVILTNIFLAKSVELYTEKNSLQAKYTLLLSFLFLPQLFFIRFLYGEIPGQFFLVLALYLISLYIKKTKWAYALAGALALSVGILLRSNYLIALIACILSLLIMSLREKNFRHLIAIAMIVIAYVIGGKGVNAYYRHVSGINYGKGIPKIMWITMGMQNGKSAEGWYNSYSLKTYLSLNQDEEKSKEAAKKDMKIRLEKFKNDPAYALNFYGNKIATTWTDPTFMSLWSGAHGGMKNTYHSSFIKSLYQDKVTRNYRILEFIMSSFNIFIALMAFIYSIIMIKKKDISFMALFTMLFMIGGFFFHILWETKAQYVATYYYFFILFAYPLTLSKSK